MSKKHLLNVGTDRRQARYHDWRSLRPDHASNPVYPTPASRRLSQLSNHLPLMLLLTGVIAKTHTTYTIKGYLIGDHQHGAADARFHRPSDVDRNHLAHLRKHITAALQGPVRDGSPTPSAVSTSTRWEYVSLRRHQYRNNHSQWLLLVCFFAKRKGSILTRILIQPSTAKPSPACNHQGIAGWSLKA